MTVCAACGHENQEAEARLQPAIAFFQSVGAIRYLRSAQALLAA